MKLFYREDGQSIVIIAVAIALILFIGLGVYNFSEVLNVKAKFRNLSDSTSFAGASAQTKGIYQWQSFNYIIPFTRMTYDLRRSFTNLYEGARVVKHVSPGYDPTADLIATDAIKHIVDPLEGLVKKIAKDPKNPTDLETADPALYNELFSFYQIDSLILAKEISESNRNLFSDDLDNFAYITLPTEVILTGEPVKYDVIPYQKKKKKINLKSRFKFELKITKKGKIIVKYPMKKKKTDTNIETTEYGSVGFFNISLADTPQTLFQRILPQTPSDKIGKMLTFSHAYLYSGSDEDINDEDLTMLDSLDVFLEYLDEMNENNEDRYKEMKKHDHPNKPDDVIIVKNLWEEMIIDYNSIYSYIYDNSLNVVFDNSAIGLAFKPVYGSIKQMNLLNMEDYQEIAIAKGYNINSTIDREKFYKSLTLRDIFETTEVFQDVVNTTIETISSDRGPLIIKMNSLLNKIRVFNINYDNGKNIPALLTNYVTTIKQEIPDTSLLEFLNFIELLTAGIQATYSGVVECNTLSNMRAGYNIESLKPSANFYTNIDSFFEIPLVRFEGS